MTGEPTHGLLSGEGKARAGEKDERHVKGRWRMDLLVDFKAYIAWLLVWFANRRQAPGGTRVWPQGHMLSCRDDPQERPSIDVAFLSPYTCNIYRVNHKYQFLWIVNNLFLHSESIFIFVMSIIYPWFYLESTERYCKIDIAHQSWKQSETIEKDECQQSLYQRHSVPIYQYFQFSDDKHQIWEQPFICACMY